uniref:ADP-dependent (S)-NAD(P)H-hydrate dehydratase n=1 Tax=uncultured marine thaumarchaeote KM3_11_F08 TaxID=1455992 RepID=A0A075G8D0_9ARCH|nr:carbohydrate kinase, YjeF related protein [uncultured marine thaumarchaeote KM3_11_F08]
MSSKTITSSMVRKYIRPRKSDSRKGDNGKVLVVGGSYMYHGAPILSSLAALRTGCDLVYTAVPKVNAQATRTASADLIVIPLADSKLTRGSVNKLLGQIPAGIDSATIGMGLAVQDIEALKLLVKSLIERDVRLSLDASALRKEILPIIKAKNVLVTPHTSEFERLFGEKIPDNKKTRISIVEKHAKKNSIIILLKGMDDIITDGTKTLINSKKTPAMTVGGTGDVLSGITASMLSQNRDVIEAAASAAFVNGQAGKIVQKNLGMHMVATDLIDVLPLIAKTFDRIK